MIKTHLVCLFTRQVVPREFPEATPLEPEAGRRGVPELPTCPTYPAMYGDSPVISVTHQKSTSTAVTVMSHPTSRGDHPCMP